jgi:hypothetical protein
MKIWGIHKKYSALSWWQNFMGDYLNIGPITIFGANAMNWAVNITSKKYGFICFKLPTINNIKGKKLCFYLSPNGTPWASTFYKGCNKKEEKLSKIRRKYLGHNFKNNDLNNKILRSINSECNIRYILNKKGF